MKKLRLLIAFFLFFSISDLVASSRMPQKTVGIFTYKFNNSPKWDPDSVYEGISGSEEAVIYISQHLADLGYHVTVFGNPPAKSKYSDKRLNPRYIDLDHDDSRLLDVAICWRYPDKALEIKKRAKKVFFWPHDTCAYTYNEDILNVFNDVFWLSQFQRLNWVSKNIALIKYENIYGNGINPEQFNFAKEKKNPHSCIYASNYARGLEILLDNWG